VTDRGTYTLLVDLPEPATVAVGALGERSFPAGGYAYTGSAFGPGGFARVARHRELAAGERTARHWHVDYLLGHPDARIADDVCTPGTDVECAVSRALRRSPATEPIDAVERFGCSDCGCRSHLAYARDRDALARAVRAAHERAVARNDAGEE